ncbi:hypothetical protein ILUMI_01989 [Ignelater luminosus]|uniref:Carboxylic ester hydrolase n=1 Tax=Ignelater luminosus TaxID=2038154 RepID=A0A8K0GJQ0_IGNLU|nr:hypothetical protein ILUMI_01989 [Ignelater luminosus]
MLHRWIAAVILLYFVNISLEEELPLVHTLQGTVRGHHLLSYGHRQYVAFEGIPYAKPPIGNLRFEEPVEAEPWSGIWNGTIIHTCLQLDWLTNEPVGSEDCLYLNVYVPEDKLNDLSNLDVIVHIHGGAFMAGDPNMGGPGYLMDRNVIYVNMNYRLGVLGFLSTEDNVVPGNMGLKDQVLALHWIQKNIRNFGGNPNSVTITGLSAGATCVHLHYFSPLSRGLFHRGISQGGTALTPWAIHKAPLEKAKRLAASIGCITSTTKELVKCLKERSARQVIQYSHDSPIKGFPLTPFSPVVEKPSSGAFITDYPYNLLKSGDIADLPWMTGSTTEEGILGILILGFQYDDLNKRWDTVLPYILSYEHTAFDSDKAVVAHKIKEFYLDGKNVTEDNVQSFIKLFGDRGFLLDLEKSARIQQIVIKSLTYAYIYGYKEESAFDELFGIKNYYGVNHGSDGHFFIHNEI